MSERDIVLEPLTAAGFAPFGEVLEAAGPPDRTINRGLCGRWHDRARIDIREGRAGVSLFRSEGFELPLALDLMERHPLGSQAFVPMEGARWLVAAAQDEGGAPGRPRAFRARGDQGANIARGVWHAVLTPLGAPGLFAVIDRIGAGANLEERAIASPWRIVERVDGV